MHRESIFIRVYQPFSRFKSASVSGRLLPPDLTESTSLAKHEEIISSPSIMTWVTKCLKGSMISMTASATDLLNSVPADLCTAQLFVEISSTARTAASISSTVLKYEKLNLTAP